MCNGFGAVFTSDMRCYFVEPCWTGDCSHELIMARAGIVEPVDPFTRRFVRVEFRDWTAGSFRFDDPYTVPAWAEENRDAIIATSENIMRRIKPHVVRYMAEMHEAHLQWKSDIAAAEKEQQDAYAKLPPVKYDIDPYASYSNLWITGYDDAEYGDAVDDEKEEGEEGEGEWEEWPVLDENEESFSFPPYMGYKVDPERQAISSAYYKKEDDACARFEETKRDGRIRMVNAIRNVNGYV